MTINDVNNIEINILENYTDIQLKGIYNMNEGKNIVRDAFHLFSSYNTSKNCNSPVRLGKQISLYDTAIGAFSNMCHVFHKRSITEKVPSKKEELRRYVEASQIILSRLQNQYNQMVYRQQRNLTYIALGLTVILSIISIVVSIILFYESKNCNNNLFSKTPTQINQQQFINRH